LLDVVVAAFVLKSLKRLSDQRIKILHLTVNGATLLTAIVSMSGYGYAVPGLIHSALNLLAVDFDVLYLLGMPEIVAVAFVLISIYWLKNLYQSESTSEDDRDTADQLAQRSDDSDTESSTTDG
jgi:hypothetical protein